MIFREPLKCDLYKWVDLKRGCPAFILGNGPSITQQNLRSLEGCFTIGTNRIYSIFDPTVLFWQDIEMTRNHSEEIDESAAIKVCRNTADRTGKYNNFQLVTSGFAWHKETWRLYGSGCSGVIAVQLAIAMGCSPIILLGCDGCYIDGKTDFYGTNPSHSERTLAGFQRAMKWLKETCPVPIYNCGYSDLWERISLEKTLEQVKPKRFSRIRHLLLLRGNL